MIVIKRRLIFWLLKAYLKRWGKIILLCFVSGLAIFFLLKTSLPYIVAALTGISKETIGITGTYTLNNLPSIVNKDISRGLTKVGSDGKPVPDVAQSWEIKDNGKVYIFHLKRGIFFIDGTPLTSKTIQFVFADVKINRPDLYTIVFTLKESYSPFLITVSKPIFKDGITGLGPYKVKKIVTNGPFLESLTVTSDIQVPSLKIYVFYPTQDSLKVAFALGEITTADNLTDTAFGNTNFAKFPQTNITKSTNYHQLVTLFYNTKDRNLSDKKLRDALSYSLPNTFSEGERAVSSLPPTSYAYNTGIDRKRDLTHAKLLLDASVGANPSTYPKLTITTLAKYKHIAEKVKASWKKIGFQTDIKIVNSLPQIFQIYLGDFQVPQDPDQYTLWHSFQENNITEFQSTRIDTLLEDGRKTIDIDKRIKIYQDFQKYLQDEQPASFLYFPYNYSISRR